MRITTVAGNGETFAAATAGRPSPHRILFVHGFTGAKEDFTDWLDPVAALGWEAAAPDLRGHGDSAKPEGLDRYGLEIIADDVVAVADALGWDRFVLLGHSMGGMVAQHVALADGGAARLHGLVLMNTSHGPVERIERQLADLACAVVAAGGMPALIEATAVLQQERDDLPRSSPAQQRVLAERPGYEEFGLRKLLAVAPDAYRALAVAMYDQSDRLPALAGLDVPVLVMVGEQDDAFLDPSRRIAEAVPGAAHEVIADAGHSPQFENPDAWWSALTRFLKEVA
ncbi:MAG: alpha/beta fold hydrolase [Acidimicrobiales bacterium]